MANPLLRRMPEREEPSGYGYPYHDPAALVAIYNQELADKGRADVRWYVSDAGTPYLSDNSEWSKRHTAELKAHADREQRSWIKAQREAAQYAA